MDKLSFKSVLSDKGISLIEILVSIVILSIIVVSFITLFVQSAKTNRVSEDIIDATYVAQSTIENIYNISKSSTSYNGKNVVDEDACKPSCQFIKNESGYEIQITIENNDLHTVLVEVYNRTTGRKEAQMETLLNWK
ncbi:type IV pilus modification PilV family protein [Bacillus nitroreducens]